MRSFGGVYNYEDSVLRGFDHKGTNDAQVAALAGDLVLVGFIGGIGTEGVILGGLTHRARKSFLDATKGPQYKSEFNGIETHINENGEWTLTFKGQPTNLQKLKDAPNQVIPEPEYDKDVGTSFMKWDKTGSFTLSDEATDGDKAQKLFIDKKNGTIDIFSGKINLKLEKNQKKTTLTSETFVVKGDKIRLGEEGASEWLIIGSTFRQEQKKMNTQLSTWLNLAKDSLSVAKTALQTAGGSMATPIAGAVAAGPQITAAATAIDLAAQALGSAAQAISAFENSGASHNYLSTISKTK